MLQTLAKELCSYDQSHKISHPQDQHLKTTYATIYEGGKHLNH